MQLPPNLIRQVQWPDALDFSYSPLQLGLGGSPWHVAVASICLCRTKRNAKVISQMFYEFPTVELMEASDVKLERVLQPLGLHKQRARSIQQLSRKWYLDTWEDLRELKGVGDYVADAVSIFCFGHPIMDCHDAVLADYLRDMPPPYMYQDGEYWFVDSDCFLNVEDAYVEFAKRKWASAA